LVKACRLRRGLVAFQPGARHIGLGGLALLLVPL